MLMHIYISTGVKYIMYKYVCDCVYVCLKISINIASDTSIVAMYIIATIKMQY